MSSCRRADRRRSVRLVRRCRTCAALPTPPFLERCVALYGRERRPLLQAVPGRFASASQPFRPQPTVPAGRPATSGPDKTGQNLKLKVRSCDATGRFGKNHETCCARKVNLLASPDAIGQRLNAPRWGAYAPAWPVATRHRLTAGNKNGLKMCEPQPWRSVRRSLAWSSDVFPEVRGRASRVSASPALSIGWRQSRSLTVREHRV